MTSPTQDWKRPAVLAVILVVLGVYTFVRGAPERGNVDRLEARLAEYELPELGYRPPAVDRFIRYYAAANPTEWRSLPMSHSAPPLTLAPGKTVIVGALLDPSIDGGGPPGIRRVRLDQLPAVNDGGCSIVNVVYDPAADEIRGAWCNGQLRAAPPIPPPPPAK